MERKKWAGLIFALIILFLIIYSIRLDYSFPHHLDEWNHITFAKKLSIESVNHVEIGFHYFLLLLSGAINLITAYKFLPAIWAVLSALTLFFLVYKKSNKNFYLAILTIIFFASIKSNDNILGLWFFTPLTFSIPFIFLFVYFFTEGIEKQNKKLILLSLVIMAFLIPFHAISVTFAIPILALYVLIWHRDYLLREWKFFLSFLIIPLAGILFLKTSMNIPWGNLLSRITDYLVFEKGWGVIERNNSFLEIYSLAGYILSGFGIYSIIKNKSKKFYIFILWPAVLIFFIILFKTSNVSFLVPFQRNLYYLAIILPVLSAFGTYEIVKEIKSIGKKEIEYVLIGLLAVFIIFGIFFSYYKTPEGLEPTKFIDEEDYKMLKWLENQERGRIIPYEKLAPAVYPLSGFNPGIRIEVFDEKRKDFIKFYLFESCEEKEEIIEKYEIKYVLSKEPIDCGWNSIYGDERYVYDLR